MRVLHHYPLCPFSRKIRLILTEKKLDFSLENEPFWERRHDLFHLNPAGQVPVLIDLNGTIISDSSVITEYLEEVYPEKSFLGQDILQKNEVRRLSIWFDQKFAKEVSLPLIYEKIIKRYLKKGPDSNIIRSAKHTIHAHLEYIAYLIDRRKWLSGDELSIADIAASSHLSVIDYFGDVPWDKHETVKDWYARIKSRPSFRSFLQDRIQGIPPSTHYTDLDF